MKPFTKTDIGDIVSISGLKWSPDGRTAAFTTIRPDLKTDRYLTDLYLVNPKNGRLKRLTEDGHVGTFQFLNPKSMIFPALRREEDRKAVENGEELTVFYQLPLDGGEAHELFRVELKGAVAEPIDRDRLLIRATHDLSRPDLAALKGKKREEALAAIREEADYDVCDEFPYRRDGAGYVNKTRSRLYLYHLKKKSLTPLTSPTFQTGDSLVDRVNLQVYFVGEDYESQETRLHSLFVYDLATGETEKLLDARTMVGAIARAGGRIFLACSDECGNSDIYSCPEAGGEKRLEYACEEDLGYNNSTDTARGSGDSFFGWRGALYFVKTNRQGSHVYRMEPGQQPEQFTQGGAMVTHFSLSKDGDMLCACLPSFGMMEIYKVEEGVLKQLTALNAATMNRYFFSQPEHFAFPCADGSVELDGWVIKPFGYEPGKRYPAILMIHGGPRGMYHGTLNCDMQVLAGQGYFVCYCNPRGGAGRSREFADLNGKYGTIDYEDMMRFVDEFTDRYPDIDGGKLGVTGASYGGYMTNWLIGHTDRFAAAAAQCCVSNWLTMYGCCDIPWFVASGQEGTPWSNFDGLWQSSPLRYADKAKTPTLFLEYGCDYRCPMDQGIQMFAALQIHGVDSRLVIFEGDSHVMVSTGKPSHRVRRHKELLAWFEKHLSGKA